MDSYTLYRHLCDALGITPAPDFGDHHDWDFAIARVRRLAEAERQRTRDLKSF